MLLPEALGQPMWPRVGMIVRHLLPQGMYPAPLHNPVTWLPFAAYVRRGWSLASERGGV